MNAIKKRHIAGWILSGLLAAFLGFSASGKFRDFPGKAEMFDHLGWSMATMKVIGVVEIVITIIFLIPHTAFFGAILLTAYLGGAVASHVRVGDPFVFQVIIGVVVWIAYLLRRWDVVRPALFGSETVLDSQTT